MKPTYKTSFSTSSENLSLYRSSPSLVLNSGGTRGTSPTFPKYDQLLMSGGQQLLMINNNNNNVNNNNNNQQQQQQESSSFSVSGNNDPTASPLTSPMLIRRPGLVSNYAKNNTTTISSNTNQQQQQSQQSGGDNSPPLTLSNKQQNSSPNNNNGQSQQSYTSMIQQNSASLLSRLNFNFCPWCGVEFKFGDVFCPVCGNQRGSAERPGLTSKRRWTKVLYEKQPYEDNHVDETFLNALVKNANFQSYSVEMVFKGAEVVTQQISTVALFVVGFLYLWEERISLPNLLALEFGLLIAGFIARFFTDFGFHGKSVLVSVKILLLLLGSLYMLSPVLMTLTKQFSGDTITACTIFLLICHLIFHDYGYVNGDSKRFSAPISLNAAIFASVMLGSRLQTSLHVFTLLTFAMELFALFPILRHHLKLYSQDLHNALTIMLVLLSVVLLVPLSKSVAVIYVASVLFVLGACPYWLVFIQKYKNSITGPWDEAVVRSRH